MTDTTASLTAELAEWTKQHQWKPASADELHLIVMEARDRAKERAADLDRQVSFLALFIERWEAAQTTEDDDRAAFDKWRARRKWVHDLRDTEIADENVTGPGFIYPNGFWIRLNTETKQDLGRYWTMCPFDLWGDLDKCERGLWEEYGSEING